MNHKRDVYPIKAPWEVFYYGNLRAYVHGISSIPHIQLTDKEKVGILIKPPPINQIVISFIDELN